MWHTGTLDNGRNGSALAAAISRPGFPVEISVIYLDIDNVVRDLIYTVEGDWRSGNLSDYGYIAMSNSSLAVMYNQCELCANTTIIAFQNANGYIQIGNFTLNGWVTTQLGSTLNPYVGTGLALQPFYKNGTADQINLFFQNQQHNLTLVSFNSAPLPGGQS